MKTPSRLMGTAKNSGFCFKARRGPTEKRSIHEYETVIAKNEPASFASACERGQRPRQRTATPHWRKRRIFSGAFILNLALLICIGTAPSQANPAVTSDPVFVGAGDIADSGDGDAATAKLLDQIAGTVFTAGDNAYQLGSKSNFKQWYAPTWGRHKARTYPTPGNHDYFFGKADAYYDYFGPRAGPAKRGYYSYNLGQWHIIALNSNIDAQTDSPQATWLRADLASHPSTCTLAYWHHPLFTSGVHQGEGENMRDIWKILHANGVDIIINGHDHDYERFAPQNDKGQKDDKGIRAFVVGTGGATLRDFKQIAANSEIRNNDTWGVLKLTLHTHRYDWEFIPVAGKNFRDRGTGPCVD